MATFYEYIELDLDDASINKGISINTIINRFKKYVSKIRYRLWEITIGLDANIILRGISSDIGEIEDWYNELRQILSFFKKYEDVYVTSNILFKSYSNEIYFGIMRVELGYGNIIIKEIKMDSLGDITNVEFP